MRLPLRRSLDTSPRAPSPARLPLIDTARCVAVLAMVVYHFSWDLRYFGFTTADVEGGLGWRIFARAIAASFLLLVGVGLVLATQKGIDVRRFLRRLGVIVAAAAAITFVTWIVFPSTFIFFGILHQIAVASVLGLLFVRLPIPVVVGGALFSFLAPSLLAGPVFDHPALIWLGLQTAFPRTNDFVPLFPWFGIVLAGIASTRLWLRFPPQHSLLQRLGQRVPWQLLWVGRHSLAIYLLHQPVLFGLVYLAAWISPPDLLGFEPQYLESCTTFCVESEVDSEVCRRTCECAALRTKAEGLWNGLMRQALSEEDEKRYFTLVDECRAAAD